MRRIFVVCSVFAIAAACHDGSGTSGPPFERGSPWPKFRGNAAQDGRSSVRPAGDGGTFWSVPTGKGIFSSPVVSADGTVYIGSADRAFYALHRDGTARWPALLTGEIIDSAGLLDNTGRVYFGSGDGILRALDAATGALAWMTPADTPGINGSYINWFEGNVALSPRGQLHVPNDDFFVYTVERSDGSVTRRSRMPDQTWSSPAFAADGRWYIGNNNLVEFLGSNLFAFDADGVELWEKYVGVGSVAASPMLTPSGLVVVGSFDGYVRAFDATSGEQRWEYGTRDHLYASPARLSDGTIVQAGTDGTVYGLDEASGMPRWTFDLRDPIRSSPAVDGDDNVYFGAGDGRLWVLDKSGKLRWSIALTGDERNDVNSSPALGRDAVYLGAESGDIFSVPYDFCLRPAEAGNPRCAAPATPALPDEGAALVYTTEFGAQPAAAPATFDANQPIVLSLVARSGGHDVLALLDGATVQATFTPATAATVDVAGNGRFVTITPAQPLAGDATGQVTLDVSADYLVNPDRQGLKLSGGTRAGSVQAQLKATLRAPGAAAAPAPAPGSVWEVHRIALPLPTLLPSYNQIGFDSLHYLVGIINTEGRPPLAWLVGAKLAEGANTTVIDPVTEAMFPLAVQYERGFLTLTNQQGLSVKVTNIVIPFQSFRLAAALGGDGNGDGPVRLTGATVCGHIATYGPFLQRLGLCNPRSDVLSVVGAAELTRFDGAPAPAAVDVGTVVFATTGTEITATLTGSSLRLADHVAALLLVDEDTGAPVALDYGLDTRRTADAAGHLSTVTLPVAGKTLPAHLRVYLMVDVTAVASATVAGS